MSWVQTTLDLLSRYTGVEKRKLTMYVLGSIIWVGLSNWKATEKDLYPQIAGSFEKPEYYANEKVRGEMFRHFGYFM